MELLLNITKGKPPFIGVVFTRVADACEKNEDLVNELADLPYQLQFHQPNGRQVKMKLLSDKLPAHREYKIEVDPVKLENFLYMTRNAPVFNFAHVLRDFDQEMIVTTFSKNKKFVLKVQRVYLMGQFTNKENWLEDLDKR